MSSASSDDSEEFPGRLLHQAALWDNAELLEDLLHGDQISHLDCRDAWGRSPLHASATTEHSRCLRILLQAGADPNVKSGPRADGKSCLHIASEHGAAENVHLLINHGADLIAKDSSGMTAFDLAEQADHTTCMDLLKNAAAEKEVALEELHSSLSDACHKGDVSRVRLILKTLGKEVPGIINGQKNGSNTLIFKACEDGYRELVRLLIDAGADCRIHPVTKYSPLYISAYYGRREICEIILKRFPHLCAVTTVEKWLPLHACVLNGHLTILDLLLRYPYPKDCMQTLRDKSNQFEYDFPFDLNSRDVTGQSALYLSCYIGNLKLVDMLVKHRIQGRRIMPSPSSLSPRRDPIQWDSANNPRGLACTQEPSPSRHRIAGGIHSLMTKLNLVKPERSLGEEDILPVDIDLYCNNNAETALHVAVKNKHHSTVQLLLSVGANPNLRMYLPDNPSEKDQDEEYVFTGSTALVEACRNQDIGMLDLLLKSGARDDDCKALFIAAQNNEDIIVAKLLALKAHPDPEYKLNKRAFEISPSHQFPSLSQKMSSCSIPSLLPSTPVMINWHGQKCIKYIKDQWFVDVSVTLNPKFRLNPRNQVIALYAITRLDISNNALSELPQVIFQMPSLRILNASQNKLESLPPSVTLMWMDGTATLPRRGKRILLTSPLSVLEEIHLKDNRLTSLPASIFLLPCLGLLDVSNNKLQTLPFKMWTSPKLREINASFNLLHFLPLRPEDPMQQDYDASFDVSDEDSLSSTGDSEHVADQRIKDNSRGFSLIHHGSTMTCVRPRDLKHHSLWGKVIQVHESPWAHQISSDGKLSASLQSLNLSHNAFTSIPAGLPCLALGLSRLNLAYNRLTDIGNANCYPVGLKHLDLSHNLICSWPFEPISEYKELEHPHSSYLNGVSSLQNACVAISKENIKNSKSSNQANRRSCGSISSLSAKKGSTGSITGLSSGTSLSCVHRRHSRLESLRTLIVADNQLIKIAVHFDEGEFQNFADIDQIELLSLSLPSPHSKVIFPSLSMLDVSNNRIREIPTNLNEFSNLSVLNIAGNIDITELPSEMGLLSRLWNLNTRGCSLQEPLKSMIDSKKYKTMDVIGYLKSILEDARPYARMKLMIVGVQGIGKTSLLEQLRQEGTGSYRKKPVEHWAKRMGNRNINTRTSRGTSMSTVGVDIGDWVYEKKIRGQSNHGPVIFRTWDFGGQKEYYATHQYFLSKRSLYLVTWKINDGEKGIEEILQWLVNIQARAPNSPVLIVGTHYDLVKDKFPSSWSEELQQKIRERFINVMDADKLGLPRVLDTIEVSCRTRHNIKLLCNLVYDTVFSLKLPGSKERLLEQKIPASYLALEDVIVAISCDRTSSGRDPVLTSEKYHALVTQEMKNRLHKAFRDTAELNQATTFLHENGVLLHYDDVTLKDLYFLDPQWLCDMLAHVVTIREINPFVKNGLMKLDDLKHVFKSSSVAPVDAKSYIVSLLNKFEVALTWDSRTLLIPSLLPPDESRAVVGEVKIPLRSRGWSRGKKFSQTPHLGDVGSSNVVMRTTKSEARSQRPHSANLTIGDIGLPQPVSGSLSNQHTSVSPSLPNLSLHVSPLQLSQHRVSPLSCVRRLLLMSYFPSGFWSRLITRVLGDESFGDAVRRYFVLPQEVLSDTSLIQALGDGPEWACWQTGIELHYAHTTLLRIREVNKGGQSREAKKTGVINGAVKDPEYRCIKFFIKLEEAWMDVEIHNSAVLEIFLPNEAVVLKRQNVPENEKDDGKMFGLGIQSVVLDPSAECVTKLMALAVDHIDTLLEDWYPTLGTRFVHTSEGKFLVSRLVPCPACLNCHHTHYTGGYDNSSQPGIPDMFGSFVEMNPLYCSMTASTLSQALGGSLSSAGSQCMPCIPPSTHSLEAHGLPHDLDSPTGAAGRGSWGSRGSAASDGDSGVGPDSNSSSRNPSCEGRPDLAPNLSPIESKPELTPIVYSFLVEECILAAYSGSSLQCPLHGLMFMARIAPDTMFLDLGENYLVHSETLHQGRLLGRGGFGFVFEGALHARGNDQMNNTLPRDIALKMMQPVNPGPNSRPSAMAAYKAAQSKWERDPLQYACKAYCSARQEVNVLLTLQHPNIVPLIGVCPRPLALVLELAPQGALDQCLKHYQRSGAHLGLLTLQAVILQVAKALEYLHGQHIIYRDLKSENVLVWELPPPFTVQDYPRVDVRLADYGISRSALPSGAKGFGGTEGFMAPEMMRHNGEEEYTEKVDCFSFGMFMYELLTTHQPYEYCDNVKEHVLEGGRPAMTNRETEYPIYMMDLMVACWSHQPRLRPSASQVVSIASAPEFTHLLDVVSIDHGYDGADVTEALLVTRNVNQHGDSNEDIDSDEVSLSNQTVWVSRSVPQVDLLTPASWNFKSLTSIEGLPEVVTAMCQVGDHVWMGDHKGFIHGYRVDGYSWVFSYCLESPIPSSDTTLTPSSVVSLFPLINLNRVGVAMGSGRVFLCYSAPPTSPNMAEGTFILTELAGEAGAANCLQGVMIMEQWHIWCGGKNGAISIFSLRKDGLVTGQDMINHSSESSSNEEKSKLLSMGSSSNETAVEQEGYSGNLRRNSRQEVFGDVVLLHCPNQANVKSSLWHSMWSYVQPGCIVFHWDAHSQKVLNRLDCSKLVPCSESLESISIEEHMTKELCQVTAISVVDSSVFVGTRWGCIIVAEAEFMSPISVFRPYEGEIREIIAIPQQYTKGDDKEELPPKVATVGKGYRQLLSRYTPTSKRDSSVSQNGIHCLLWRSHQWLNS